MNPALPTLPSTPVFFFARLQLPSAFSTSPWRKKMFMSIYSWVIAASCPWIQIPSCLTAAITSCHSTSFRLQKSDSHFFRINVSLWCKFKQYILFIHSYYSFICSLVNRSGELRMQKLRSHLMRTQSLNVLPFKPGVGQYIAIHATLTAGEFFLAYFYPSSPFTCIFFPKPLPIFYPVLACRIK